MKIIIYKPDDTPMVLFEYGDKADHVIGWHDAGELRDRINAFLEDITEDEWNGLANGNRVRRKKEGE